LKLKCDEPLSNVAFNLNVRRYTVEQAEHMGLSVGAARHLIEVGRCRLTVLKPDLKARLVSAISS
jgi:hypothetical protein